jgi:hypothetical protein
MRTRTVAVVLAVVLLSNPGMAQPAEGEAAGMEAPSTQPAFQTPEAAADTESPPDPAPAQSSAPRAVPEGQWVYTQQYGWVWMPYGDAFTYVPPDGYGEPYEYVYATPYGWTWVVAPWVWGWGPWPFFGVHGAFRFAWFGHGWWRSPWRWHFQHVPFHGVHGGFAFHGIRAAPVRGGPVMRGAPVGRAFVGRAGGGGGHVGGSGRGRGGHR